MRSNNAKVLFLLLGSFILIIGCQNSMKDAHNSHEHTQDSSVVYTCPMHPEIESNKPGVCPECNMHLEIKEDLEHVLISPNKQVLSRQETVTLQPAIKNSSLKAHGYIELNETRNQSISARFSGRIEKLYVKYSGQFVNIGEKIMEIYSPDLNTFQEEHLLLLKLSDKKTLIEQSREKLRLLGIADDQIFQLEKNGKTTSSITVFSPHQGFVFFDTQTQDQLMNSSKSASSTESMGMASQKSSEKSYSSSGQIREGMYINLGQTLFTINDLQTVWAMVSIPSEYISEINENQSLEIISELFTKKTLIGKVDLIEPYYEEKQQRFVRARVELQNNNNELKINSLIQAAIPLQDKNNFQLPSSAVYHTGLNDIVWVKEGQTKNGAGIFKLRKVTTATKTNGSITILSGLQSGEEVAKEAGLMADSETILNLSVQ